MGVMVMDKLFIGLKDAIIHGQTQAAMDKTKLLLNKGIGINEIIKKATNSSFKELGKKMEKGEITIPDVLMSSRAMLAVMHVMEPVLSNDKGFTKGIVVIGTVAGDLHDIGKKLVSMMLKGHGYTVIDIGIDVTEEVFVDAVKKYRPDVLAMSSLLTLTLIEFKNVMEALMENGLRSEVKVIVGGAPVNIKYAKEVGADAYASDVFEAVEAVDDLIHNRIGKFSL
jgi:5-methyltetrahydrofolate--homocysteine methyltransferase